MKKNILVIVAIALIGTVTLTLNSLRAQDAATPPVVVPQAPPPGPPPGARPGMPPPGFRGRPGNRYRQTVMFLKMAKTDLEHSKDDFGGHRQSAMDACDKAVQELEAVQASIQAAAAAAAKAATPPQDAQQAPAPTPTPAPAPPQ